MTALNARALFLLFFLGCDSVSVSPAPLVHVQTDATFDDFFPQVRRVFPEQNDSVLVAAMGALEINTSGDFLIPDMSEGNVKYYWRDGRLRSVIGRKGRGPGELMTPFFARFVGDSVLVADLAYNPTLTLFAPDGTFQSRLVLRDIVTLQGMHILANGNLLLAGYSPKESNDSLLFEVSQAGAVIRSMLPIRHVRPTDSDPDPRQDWATFRTAFLAVSNDSAYVVNTLSDSVWTVSLTTGAYKRLRLDIAGLQLPTQLPKEGLGSLKAMTDFHKQFHFASGVAVWNSVLVITFARGDMSADDVITVLRSPEATWRGVRGKPRFIGIGGGILAGIRGVADSLSIDFVDPVGGRNAAHARDP